MLAFVNVIKLLLMEMLSQISYRGALTKTTTHVRYALSK